MPMADDRRLRGPGLVLGSVWDGILGGIARVGFYPPRGLLIPRPL
jgi:hypothetical protein